LYVSGSKIDPGIWHPERATPIFTNKITPHSEILRAITDPIVHPFISDFNCRGKLLKESKMNRSILLLGSLMLVAWLFPPVSIAKSILPPPCCDWNESTANFQTASNQAVSLVSVGIASPTGGLLAEQGKLSSRISRNRLPAESTQTLHEVYVTERQAFDRMPELKKNSHVPERRSY
jgi:hypothetical protein